MKILHTADWHIGKSLYKHDLYEDILLFFDALVDIIVREQVEVLLVSGDVFDLANPSNTDKEIYYQFLTRLTSLHINTIITAGNHDSARMLEAPKELLKHLHIHVVGSADSFENQVIPLLDKQQNEKACILAIPYLRDRDIRQITSGEKYQDKVEATRVGLVNHYKSILAYAQKAGHRGPFIAMGHLYMQGAHVSDSEREIQIGNTAGIAVEQFSQLFDYMALGHIHRPQKLNKEGTIRYSGSPISLSFSERKDDKVVILLELKENKIDQIKTLSLEKNRDLIRISGSLDHIKHSLSTIKQDKKLPAFVELHAQELERDQAKILELIQLAHQESESYKVVHHKIQFTNQLNTLLEQEDTSSIQELRPIDVFRSKMEEEIQDDDLKKELELKFYELLESVNEACD